MKHLEKAKRTDKLKQTSKGEAFVSDGPEKALISKEISKRIHKVLHDMDEPYKEVFSLRTFGELSFQDIAELFRKSENWARVTYFRAKSKIKEALENENEM